MGILARPFFCLLVLFSCAAELTAQETTYVTLVVYRVSNAGRVDATALNAFCILPAANRYQEVVDSRIDPAPTAEVTDQEKQRVIGVQFGALPAGQVRSVRVMVWTKLKPVTVPLTTVENAPTLTEELRKGNLADDKLLNLDKLRPVAEKTVGSKTRDLDKARALYDYMAKNCSYDIDESEDPADKVITGRPASCSELAYTYVGLCRSLGIPARLVSACVNRHGLSPSADWRAHRWAEFFAEGIGWIPVDPTNKLNYPNENFFGRQQPKYLTVIDDGVPLANFVDPGWQIVWLTGEPASINPEVTRSAVWAVSSNRTDEAAFFAEACAALKDPDAKKRLAAVQDWDRQRKPIRSGFLLEALFDSDAEVVKAAAAAVARLKDPSILIGLMSRIEHERDYPVIEALLATARQLLKEGEVERRAEAVTELCKSRSETSLKLLDDIWESESRPIRKAAAQTLYKFGDKPAVHKAYRKLVDDSDDYIRVISALRWSRVGSHEALDRVTDLLESKVRWDRQEAIEVLQKKTGDAFGYDATLKPDTRRNQEAIEKFRDWLDTHKEAK